jgi:Ca2+-binding EF-hand superfamily protein
MWMAIGAATSILQSLTSSSTSSTTSAGQSQDASNPFALGSSSQDAVSTGFTPVGSGGSQISPQTMSALIGAQEESGPTSSSAPTSQSAALQDLFSQIDANGDGEISKSEFEGALGAGGTNVAAADSVFSQLDANGDGNVSLDELKNALQGAGGHHGGHHHMNADAGSSGSTDGSSASTSADGSNDPLMQALAASSASGNTGNSLSSSVVPIDQAHLLPISLSASSYSAMEAMIQSGASAFAASAANSLSMNV